MPSQHAGRQRTVRLNEDEDALLARLAKDHGGIKGAVVAGLKLLDGANDIDLPAVMRRAADELATYQREARAREIKASAQARFGKKKGE